MLALLYLIMVWLRLARLALDLVEYLGYLLLKPIGIDSASLAAQRRANTTIITATLGTEPHFEQVVRLWLKADPGEVIITTVDAQFSQVKELLDGIGDSRISLYSVDAPSARKQYYKSISRVKTAFFVATDDRTRWSHSTLDTILAPFQDPSVGGVTGLQEVRPADGRQLGVWESMGALNLARRNVQHSALTYFNHGQILNLSGRLSAYRAGIFAEPGFRDAFLSELWLGRYRLNTGDDNTLTTWVVRRGWRTRFQNAEGVRVAAGTNKDATYTRQLLRWLRDTTRCYLSDLAFAIRSGERRHLSRAISNLLVYYITDFATLLEVGFLLLVSISRTCFDVGDEEFSTPLLHLLCEHLVISSVLTVFEHLPFFSSLTALQFFPTTVAYVYIRAGVALYSWITLHKASNFSYTKSEAIGGKMKKMAG